MSFPRYPEYKDSGVEWLGKVPAHWEIKSIRYILDAIGDVDHFMPESVEKGVPYLMTGDLKEFVSDVNLDDCKQVSHNDYLALAKRIKSSKGDVIMARYATIGTSMYVDIDVDFLASYSCVTLKTNHSKMIGFYLFQYMKSDAFRQGVDNQINTNTQGNVGIKDLQNVKIAVAPIDEQAAIAAFLDRETAKIDALVAEQRRLMALLKEKRQAVISHAVTRGLNPHATMKPSGIEWLGDVPEHWRVVPLRWAAKICSGDGLSSTDVEAIDDDEHTVRVIGGNGLMGYTDKPNVSHSILAVGRVGALCGNVHLVHPPAWITDNALVLDPVSSIFDLRFLSMTLRSRNLNEIASKTAQPLITGTQVSDQRIPCPPLPEQDAIAAYLTEESQKFDNLTTEAQRAIDLLQERRTALISAAVTGHIDVRGTL